jgi:hypothetical protein
MVGGGCSKERDKYKRERYIIHTLDGVESRTDMCTELIYTYYCLSTELICTYYCLRCSVPETHSGLPSGNVFSDSPL